MAGCLACFGMSSSAEGRKAGPGKQQNGAAASPRPENRLNLRPQELYMVDDFPMDLEEAQKWVVVRRAKPDAKYRMICLPWAGGSSTIYVGWDALMPDVEIVAVELPGRQGRQKERAYLSIYPMVARLAEAMEVLGYLRPNSKQVIIQGHSFGSLVAIHLAWALRQAYNFTPYYVVLAGGIPPEGRWNTEVADMSDEKLVKVLVDYGGIPVELAKNKEMMDRHLPNIRADYVCVDYYACLTDAPLTCPILAVGGTLDELYGPKTAQKWAPHTTSTFTRRNITASHFFPKLARDDYIAIIDEVVLQGKTESDPIPDDLPVDAKEKQRIPPVMYEPGKVPVYTGGGVGR